MKVQFGYEITQAIMAERQRQKVTVKKLAEKSGISKATIENMTCRRETIPSLHTCLPLLHALGLEMVIVRRKSDGDA